MGSSTRAYDNQPKTQDMILVSHLLFNLIAFQAEKEYNDYHDHMEEIQRGVKKHLFVGHGPTQDEFEKRDFATTNDVFYN